jgi:mRNA interferase MazF
MDKINKIMDWVKDLIYLNTIAASAERRVVKKYEVYYCDLGFGVGSEMEKRRKVVILQNDVGNANSPNTIVAPITGTGGIPPVTAPITGTYNYTDHDGTVKTLYGYVKLSDIVRVSKARLRGNCLTTLVDECEDIDNKVLVSFGLMKKFNDLIKKETNFKKTIKRLASERDQFRTELEELKKKQTESESVAVEVETA